MSATLSAVRAQTRIWLSVRSLATPKNRDAVVENLHGAFPPASVLHCLPPCSSLRACYNTHFFRIRSRVKAWWLLFAASRSITAALEKME